MTQHRRNETTNSSFSDWHRQASLKRWLSSLDAWRCAMIDIDDVEWCPWCYEPLALIEVKHIDEKAQAWTVTRKLAERAGLPGYKLVWSNDTDAADEPTAFHLHDGDTVTNLDASELARFLVDLRDRHQCE